MVPFLHHRLQRSLLAEMASGFYTEGSRFLSNRKICRLWKVSDTTAKKSLTHLVRNGLLEVRDRSGYYVRAGSQAKALLLLHRNSSRKLPPPTTWSVKRFQLLPKTEEKHRQIVVILAGKSRFLDRFPPPYHILEAEYASGLFQKAMQNHCAVHFYVDNGTKVRRRIIVDRILAQRPDGVIAFRRLDSYAPLKPMIAPLVAADIPVVTVFDDCEQINVMSLNIDNIGMGYDAVKRFLRLGHRRIAVALPKGATRYFNDRALGARMAVADARRHDATLDILWLPLHRPFSSRVVQCFRDPQRRPTAVFVTTAMLFKGLWPVLRKLRLNIPRDISIIMCAGTTYLPQYKRAFDAMKIDFEKLGALAMSRLLRLWEGRTEEQALALKLPYVATGSVQALKRTAAMGVSGQQGGTRRHGRKPPSSR